MKEEEILKQIQEKETKILQEEQKISRQEKNLIAMDRQLLKKEENIAVQEEEVVATELNHFQTFFINRAKKHKIIFQLIIILGVVLVWRGLWNLFDQTPIIQSGIISLLVGLVLLWVFNKITDLG